MRRLWYLLFFLGVPVRADISSHLNVASQDGNVSNYPYKLTFSSGAVVDNGDGTMSVTVSTYNSSGGGGVSLSSTNTWTAQQVFSSLQSSTFTSVNVTGAGATGINTVASFDVGSQTTASTGTLLVTDINNIDMNSAGVYGDEPICSVSKYNVTSGDALFCVGSGQQGRQFCIKDRTATNFSSGLDANGVRLGVLGALYISSDQSGNEWIRMFDSNENITVNTKGNIILSPDDWQNGSNYVGVGQTVPQAFLHVNDYESNADAATAFAVSASAGATPWFISVSSAGHVEYGGGTPSVASGAGDCGTTPAIAGNDMIGRITVGSAANGGKCTVTFSNGLWAHTPICDCNDETTAILVRATGISKTSFACSGVLVAGDTLDYACFGYR